MTEGEPVLPVDEDGGGDASQGVEPGQGGADPDGMDSDIYTPTSFGDYQIREGEYGPLDPTDDE